MADNTGQAGTDTIATDDVATLNGAASSGVKVPRGKVTYGDDGTSRDVSDLFPLPIRQRDTNTSRSPLISTFQALNAVPLIGLVNSTFFATTSITDNYTTSATGTGAATVTANDGFALLTTGATAASSIQITSKDFCTYNGIGELMFLNGLRAPQAGAAGVVKRWGAYDANNGYFFEDNAGTFRVVSRKGGVDTAVASGSFNGLLGATYALDQNSHFFQILMTGGRAIFMIDQVLLHLAAVPAGATTTSGSLNLPIRVEITSTVASQTLELRGQNIGRIGTVDSKRLNEGLLDANDAELVRAVLTGSTGAANTYVNALMTAAGAQIFSPTDGYKATYTATITSLANALVSDLLVVTGSATKTIKITKIELEAAATAATVNTFVASKRSTANSGGTTAAAVVGPLDSNNAAATATAVGYTAAPTKGTEVAIARSQRVLVPAVAANPVQIVWDWGNRPSQAPTLRGTTQQLAIGSLTAIAGSVYTITVEWTEE